MSGFPETLRFLYCTELDCVREATYLLEIVVHGTVFRGLACDTHERAFGRSADRAVTRYSATRRVRAMP